MVSASRTPSGEVETDGDTHDETECHDAARSLWLKRQGYRVVRFTNDDVEKELDAVLQEIVDVASSLPIARTSRT